MGSKALALRLLAQASIFALGVLAWLAVTRGLYATALLCALAGAALALDLAQKPGAWRVVRPTPIQARTGFAAALNRRRLELLLDQTPSPILLGMGDDRIVAANRAARRAFDTPHALPDAARLALTGDRPLSSLTSPLRWRDASYAVSRAEIVDDDGHADLVVLTDMTADVRAAEAAALRDLLRVLNHELMNALTPVASMSRSALDLLRDGGPAATGQAISALERAVARTEGLRDFIDAYRTLTRLPPPAPRVVDLPAWLDVARESFRAQWAARGVTLDCPPPPADEIRIDADQMWLAIGNLLNNAAEAALERPDPHVRLGVHRTESEIRFLVEDSGPGVPNDHTDQVCLPFFTTKATGSGVGLSLARQIAQGHGGALTLLPAAPDAPLGGARFSLIVPL
ncbi:PAS domain-containing sensor histidine kinase [Caulobacter sp. UNC279MFTsu5.1]|uniref:sensor histidine kinase n=1 Tax=Caulobacter sp. UNC279MFTsu5.1 TaxID=1502775 RepID=UPI00036D5992|nr:HAMP domain-containing sensor histidine kinase [Caulobacter sp. UNC279MFTsu5.1]SFK36943.1 Signal transduction histidine kinase [Caulobacter sp. UNC279MFTsu5.1]